MLFGDFDISRKLAYISKYYRTSKDIRNHNIYQLSCDIKDIDIQGNLTIFVSLFFMSSNAPNWEFMKYYAIMGRILIGHGIGAWHNALSIATYS